MTHGSSPEQKKAVDKRLRSSAKAHDKKIDALLAKKTVMAAPEVSTDSRVRSQHVRPDNRAEILVMETDANDFVAYCRAHSTQSRSFATQEQATKAAYKSEAWCSGCAPMADLSTKAKTRSGSH